MLTLKSNGKPGEMKAVTNWLGKIVLLGGVAVLGQGFIVWRDAAVIKSEVAQVREMLAAHQDQQKEVERQRGEHAAELAAEVVAAKKTVDDSMHVLDRRIQRIEDLCCAVSHTR